MGALDQYLSSSTAASPGSSDAGALSTYLKTAPAKIVPFQKPASTIVPPPAFSLTPPKSAVPTSPKDISITPGATPISPTTQTSKEPAALKPDSTKPGFFTGIQKVGGAATDLIDKGLSDIQSHPLDAAGKVIHYVTGYNPVTKEREMVSPLAEDFAQGTARSIGSVGLTVMNKTLNALGRKDLEQKTVDLNAPGLPGHIAKIVFGQDQSIQDIPTRVAQATDIAKRLGFGSSSGTTSTIGIVGGTLLDLLGLGEGAANEVVDKLVATKTVDEALDVLKNTKGINLATSEAERIAPDLAAATSKPEVEAILKSVQLSAPEKAAEVVARPSVVEPKAEIPKVIEHPVDEVVPKKTPLVGSQFAATERKVINPKEVDSAQAMLDFRKANLADLKKDGVTSGAEFERAQQKLKEAKDALSLAKGGSKQLTPFGRGEVNAELQTIANRGEQLSEHETPLFKQPEKVDKVREAMAAAQRGQTLKEVRLTDLGTTPEKRSLWQTFKEAMAPAKSLDKEEAAIYQKWSRQQLVATAKANDEFAKFGNLIPEKDGLDIIRDYEAGRATPFTGDIKTAFNDLREEAVRKGLNVGYIERYLPHVYKNDKQEIQSAIEKYLADKGMNPEQIQAYVMGNPIDAEAAQRMGLTPFFSRDRVFPTYEDAMKYGLTPKYTHPAQLVAYYRQEMEKALANRDFMFELVSKGKILPAATAPEAWREVSLPGGSSHRWYAPPNLARVLNARFADPALQGFGGKFFEGTAWLSKKAQEVALSAGVPKTSINFFTLGQVIREGTAGNWKVIPAFIRANFPGLTEKFFSANGQYLKMMAQEGINLGNRIGSFGRAYANLVEKKTWTEWLGNAWDKAFNDATFASFMPQMQTQMFKDVYEKAVAGGTGEIVARKLAGDTVKANFGLMEDVARSKATEDVLSSIAFAPRFREGILNSYANVLKSVSSEWRNPAFNRNRRLLVGMAITGGLYDAANYSMNGQHMWQNPPGHELELRIPLKDGNNAYVAWMPSYLTIARNLTEAAINLPQGHIDVVKQKIGSLFSMPLNLAAQVWANRDYFGNPIYLATDTPGVQMGKIAEFAGLSISHPYVKGLYQLLVRPTVQTKLFGMTRTSTPPTIPTILASVLELPLKVTTAQAESANAFYDQQQVISQLNAQQKAKIAPIYKQLEDYKANKEYAKATALLDTLDETDRATLKKIYTAAATAETKRNQATLYNTFQDFVKARDAKDYTKARQIIDGLTDDQKKTFAQLNKQYQKTGSAAPQMDPGQHSDTNIISRIVTYAKAIGTDPLTAFDDIFNGQKIIRVANGTVFVERMPFQSPKNLLPLSSQTESDRQARAQGLASPKGMRLDHTVPLELGGNNKESNLKLISEAQWASYTPVEDYLGRKLKSGGITKQQAQSAIKSFKDGKLTAQQVYDQYQ